MFLEVVLSAIFIPYFGFYAVLFLRFVYTYFIAPLRKTPIDLKSTGQWAVVTGCTDGVGKEFAIKLAKIGMDLVLISRSEIKLIHLQNDLSNTYNVKIKVIAADFTDTNKILPEIRKQIEGLDIGILINNVGVLNGYKEFLEEKYTVLKDIIEVNVRGTVGMTSIVLPSMVKNKKGVIINNSSMSALCDSPFMTCYGASKKFMLKFSNDLNTEYKQHGITVQCLTPFFIASKLSRMSKTNWFVPSPSVYVQSAMKTVGIHDVTTGFFQHDLLFAGLQLASVIPLFGSWLSFGVLYVVKKRHGG